jgi:prophage maintenance system killer protein
MSDLVRVGLAVVLLASLREEHTFAQGGKRVAMALAEPP